MEPWQDLRVMTKKGWCHIPQVSRTGASPLEAAEYHKDTHTHTHTDLKHRLLQAINITEDEWQKKKKKKKKKKGYYKH